ncbi:MAG TPA: tripartite tricarboxylate transporter TctB family protein [Clostridia bacterium]|nr:tripartite tricarboxylate transporter TctB family protein [Clostridia bacterium]
MELLFNLFIGCVLLMFLVCGATISTASVAADHLGAGGFPMIFAAIGLVLLAFSTLQTLRAPKAAKEPSGVSISDYKRVGVIVLLLLGYILTIKSLGFAIVTLAFTAGSITALGYKSYGKTAVFSLLFTAMLIVIFGRIFFIALPRGIGIIKAFSYYLY